MRSSVPEAVNSMQTAALGGPWECPICHMRLDASSFDRAEVVAISEATQVRAAACIVHFGDVGSSQYKSALLALAMAAQKETQS